MSFSQNISPPVCEITNVYARLIFRIIVLFFVQQVEWLQSCSCNYCRTAKWVITSLEMVVEVIEISAHERWWRLISHGPLHHRLHGNEKKPRLAPARWSVENKKRQKLLWTIVVITRMLTCCAVGPSLSRIPNMTCSKLVFSSSPFAVWFWLFLWKQSLLLLRSCVLEQICVIWLQLSNQMVSFPLTHHWIIQPGFYWLFITRFSPNTELSKAARQSKGGESEYSRNSQHTFQCQEVWLRAL